MSDEINPAENGAATEKLIHLALPVRLTYMAKGERGVPEMACTYDIHPRGARLLSYRDVRIGDLVTVERGRSKAVCEVVWAADANSPLRGQFIVQCPDGSRSPWEEELRHAEEQYLPLAADAKLNRASVDAYRNQNRRRRPRFAVEGGAEAIHIGGKSRVEGRVEQLSEYGCRISAGNLPAPGTGLRLVLNLCDVTVALKGQVKYQRENRSVGIEFQEIRHGDRPLLSYVLGELGKRPAEEFSDLEVVTEPVIAPGG